MIVGVITGGATALFAIFSIIATSTGPTYTSESNRSAPTANRRKAAATQQVSGRSGVTQSQSPENSRSAEEPVENENTDKRQQQVLDDTIDTASDSTDEAAAKTFNYSAARLMRRLSHIGRLAGDIPGSDEYSVPRSAWERSDLRDGTARWMAQQGPNMFEITGLPQVRSVSYMSGFARDDLSHNASVLVRLLLVTRAVDSQIDDVALNLVREELLTWLEDPAEATSYSTPSAEWSLQLLEPIILLKAVPANSATERSTLRVWTDITGQFSVQASFEGYGMGKVRLRKQDDSVIQVDIERLSPDSRNFLRETLRDRGVQANF